MLTPQQPRYDGGVWHVEGMRNECIVASGIAYYEQCNTGPSSLAFRCAVAEPAYEQNDDRGPPAVYGLSNGEALVQPLGAIDTCEGRCIAFPNVFQHRVAPFSLLDASKPGHRSILVLFLVDPTISILSTSRVPPQQKDWLPAAGGDSAVTDALAVSASVERAGRLVPRLAHVAGRGRAAQREADARAQVLRRREHVDRVRARVQPMRALIRTYIGRSESGQCRARRSVVA